MFVSAIILAAGQGKRMNKGINKQFLEVKDQPVLVYTIEAFLKNCRVDEIVLVVNEKEITLIEDNIISTYFATNRIQDKSKSIKIIPGGEERYYSVHNGLKEINNDASIVLVHDGARPLVSQKEIDDIIDALKIEHACILGVKAKNTYKVVDDDGYVTTTVPRENLYSILTPQGFRKDVIIEAYKKGMNDPTGITDDGMMVEKHTQYRVKIIEGNYQNIKITTPDDLVTMEKIVEEQLFL
jgi:2-C-methyl-D-erythritol 4-phosphate cytidylyltransferase